MALMAPAMALAMALAVALALALTLAVAPHLGPGPRAIVEKSENIRILKVLRMGLPIVEILSGLSGGIFSLSRIPQLHLN